jgi:hypothetical protein
VQGSRRPAFAAALAIAAGACGETSETDAAPTSSTVTAAKATAAPRQEWSAFSEPGWEVESAVEGQLTAGGDGDAVLVLHGTDPAKIVRNDSLGPEVLDLNPRKLVFLLRGDGVYRKTAEIAGFLPPANSEDAPCLIDPLEEGGITISGNVLDVQTHYWTSCGSYGVTHETYKFRKEGERFRLIGYDRSEWSRSTHDEDTVSVNFLTGRRETASGSLDDEPTVARPKNVTRIDAEKYWLDALPLGGCQAVEAELSWCFD